MLKKFNHYFSDESFFIKPVSSFRYGVPSARKISWNHSTGSPPSGIGVSHAYLVFVLPVTNPQLIAPTFCFLKVEV